MNKSTTIIVLQNNEDDSDRCQTELPTNFVVKYKSTDHKKVLAAVKECKPDFLFAPLFTPKADGLYIVKKVKELSEKTQCMLYGQQNLSPEIIKIVFDLGASLFAFVPINFDDLRGKLIKSLNNECYTLSDRIVKSEKTTEGELEETTLSVRKIIEKYNKEKELDLIIGRLFINLGISPNIKGFNYLRTAIIMLINEPRLIEAVTKKLYPSVGNQYNTTASKVERAIRHAIEVAWNRGKTDVFNEMLGVNAYTPNDRPTNSEFMALVADRLILQNFTLY